MDVTWLARWRDGRIAFHEGRPNGFLERHVARLDGRRRVLVPLCGKAEDLAFLAARGHDVIGIELAELAVRAFFDEHGLTPAVAPRGPFTAFTVGIAADTAEPRDAAAADPAHPAGSLTLLVGDLFAATPELTGPIDAVYDRAALIALPPDLRPRYAAALRSLLPAAAPLLVITLEYDQRAMQGPPFSVPESELRALYPAAELALLDERQAPEDGGKCSQSGVKATERCFLIGPRDARP
jgi:thiopurine S-methyltransferase